MMLGGWKKIEILHQVDLAKISHYRPGFDTFRWLFGIFFHQEYDRLQHILTKAKPPELFLGTLQNPFLDGLRLSSPKQTHKRWFGQNYAGLFRLTVPANERQTGKNRLRIRQKQNKDKRENRNMSRRFADSPMFDTVETLPIHLSE